MQYFDLIVHTVTAVPAENRFDRISPDHPTIVRAAAHRVASELGWGENRAERFADHCNHYAERHTLTLSATQITMYAVEATKILLGEFNGHPSMILTAATLAMPHSHQTHANLITVTRNVETRRAKTIKIARHPEVVTMYRVVQGDEILRDNLETLDDALFWQSMNSWVEETLQRIKNPNE